MLSLCNSTSTVNTTELGFQVLEKDGGWASCRWPISFQFSAKCDLFDVYLRLSSESSVRKFGVILESEVDVGISFACAQYGSGVDVGVNSVSIERLEWRGAGESALSTGSGSVDDPACSEGSAPIRRSRIVQCTDFSPANCIRLRLSTTAAVTATASGCVLRIRVFGVSHGDRDNDEHDNVMAMNTDYIPVGSVRESKHTNPFLGDTASVNVSRRGNFCVSEQSIGDRLRDARDQLQASFVADDFDAAERLEKQIVGLQRSLHYIRSMSNAKATAILGNNFELASSLKAEIERHSASDGHSSFANGWSFMPSAAGADVGTGTGTNSNIGTNVLKPSKAMTEVPADTRLEDWIDSSGLCSAATKLVAPVPAPDVAKSDPVADTVPVLLVSGTDEDDHVNSEHQDVPSAVEATVQVAPPSPPPFAEGAEHAATPSSPVADMKPASSPMQKFGTVDVGAQRDVASASKPGANEHLLNTKVDAPQEVMDMLGEEACAKLFGSSWQECSESLQSLQTDIGNERFSLSSVHDLRCMSLLLERTVQHRNPGVVEKAVDLLSSLLDAVKSDTFGPSKRNVFRRLVRLLVNCCTNDHSRIRDAGQAALSLFCSSAQFGVQYTLKSVLHNSSPKKFWKLSCRWVDVVSSLLQEFGVPQEAEGMEPGTSDEVSVSAILQHLLPFLNHSDSRVKQSARECIFIIYSQCGLSVVLEEIKGIPVSVQQALKNYLVERSKQPQIA